MPGPSPLLRRLAALTAALGIAGPARAQDSVAPGGDRLSAPAPEPPRLASPPVLIHLEPAVLPPGTVYPAPEVSVLLTLDVTRTGTVARAVIAEGIGAPFDDAALAAGAALRFEPARLTDGSAVPVQLRFRLRMVAPVIETATVAVEPPPPPPLTETYRGQLLERGTRRPLAQVPVSATRDGEILSESTTDDEGRFSLAVDTSTFTLVAEPGTHETLVRGELRAQSGSVEADRYYLLARPNQYAIEVRGQARRRGAAQRVVTREVVRTLPGTQGDTLKVLQNLPGVARPAFGGGPLVLRGATPGDSRTFLEGQEIPQIFHFGGLRSTFAATFLEAVELIPGNFGPDYGRAIGGVVDVRVRDPASDLFHGEVDLNFFDAGFAMEGPINSELAVGGGFRRSYIDTILPAVIPDDASVSFDVAPRYYDYQLIAAWRPAPDHRVRAFFYGALDKVELLFAEPGADPKVRGPLSARTLFHNLQVEWSSRPASNLSQETSLKAGLTNLQFLLGPEFYFDLDVQTLSLRSAWSLRAHPQLTLRLGTDSRVQLVQIGLTSPSPPKEGENAVPISTREVLGVTDDANLVEPAFFLEAIWKPVDVLQVLGSVRLDYYDAIDAVTVDPRLTFQLAAAEDWTVRGGVGLYQQQPQYDETADITGTPSLSAPRSLQTSLGVEHRPIAGVSWEVIGFYKALDRIVSRGQGADAPAFTNDGTGRIFGLEALVKATVPELFTGWIAYTFQRSFRTDRPGEEERVFDFDQPHILTALGTFELGAGWSAGARFRLVSGNPSAPVISSLYDAVADVFVPVYGPKTERLGTFHQLDLRVDKEWVFDTWKLGIYLDVQNTYNHGNQEGWRYSYDYRQREAVTGLPVVPVLGARGEW